MQLNIRANVLTNGQRLLDDQHSAGCSEMLAIEAVEVESTGQPVAFERYLVRARRHSRVYERGNAPPEHVEDFQ